MAGDGQAGPLRDWLEEDQASLILYGQLAEDTARWRQNGKDSSLLNRQVPAGAAGRRASGPPIRAGTLARLLARADFLRLEPAGVHPGLVERRNAGDGPGPAAPGGARWSGSRSGSARNSADQQRTVDASDRPAGAEHGAEATDPVTASLLAGGLMADGADRTHTLQPARNAAAARVHPAAQSAW